MQFTGQGLAQTAQRELSHRVRCRVRVALHPGGGTGEQHRSAARVQHPPGCLLGHEECPERRYLEYVAHIGRIEFRDRTPHPWARLVDGDVEGAIHGVDRPEEFGHGARHAGVALQRRSVDLGAQVLQFLDVAGYQDRTVRALRERSSYRSGQA